MSMHLTYQSCRPRLINPVVHNTPGLNDLLDIPAQWLPYCPVMHGSHTIYSASQVLGPFPVGIPEDIFVKYA